MGCIVMRKIRTIHDWKNTEANGQITSSDRDKVIAIPLGFFPSSYNKNKSLAVIIHIFYVDLIDQIFSYINNFPSGTDIYISTNEQWKSKQIVSSFKNYKKGALTVRVFPNRGRDIAPKLVGFREIYDNYEFIVHLHSKKSTHNIALDGWRTYLYDSLCGSKEQIYDILGIFCDCPDLGLLFPDHYTPIRKWALWGENFAAARQLLRRLDYTMNAGHPLDFPSGSMFWARSAALKPLLNLELDFNDFPEECGQKDCTLAHSIERLYAIICELAGYDWLKIGQAPSSSLDRAFLSVQSRTHLKQLIMRNTVRLTTGEKI
jgi:lipopolysaccharide biosynthesis protein